MKGKKKYLWALWLVILCALLMITGTYAAYISIRNAKSVTVAKTATTEIRFSSNYLYLRERSDSLMPLKMISVSGQGDVSAAVTVCNYPQSDLKKVHEEDITYTLYAQLRDTAGEALTGDALTQAVAALQINGQAFAADGSLSLTGQTLTGGKASQNVYAVTCAKENLALLSTLTVEMRAEPDSCPNCAIGSHLLKARLWLSASGNEDGSWSGQFQASVTRLVLSLSPRSVISAASLLPPSFWPLQAWSRVSTSPVSLYLHPVKWSREARHSSAGPSCKLLATPPITLPPSPFTVQRR